MDNEQLLMQLGKFDFLARTPGLGSRVPVERDDLRRLLADSDELAALKARIAGAAVGECTAAGWLEVDGESMCGFFVSVRDKEQLCRNPFGQRVALLPVGEVEG